MVTNNLIFSKDLEIGTIADSVYRFSSVKDNEAKSLMFIADFFDNYQNGGYTLTEKGKNIVLEAYDFAAIALF